ncbi:Cytochrome c oxidase subunit 4 [Diaporthe australafricana]|uniref:Cytochrome c oxidase subunit 4 n=1 Tax=Diaporthe australafricana TaxID=127596 RepID=A0ABR3WGJ8_9PEZI
MPSTSLDSCWVDDYPGPNSTEGSSSQDNQCGPRFEEIDATDEMKSYSRNASYKSLDKPRQTKQDDHVVDGDENMGSGSGRGSDQLNNRAILPELIDLTLAQHRMILSLREVNKEALGALQIISARLDLVEEELSLMRSSLADQTESSLFSGVRSFEDTERDTSDDYVPTFDLTDIGATLAAGPGPGLGSEFGCSRYLASESSLSSRSSKQRRRSPRPEREEHVKRTRISYDGLGGQDPKKPPSTYIFSSSTHARQSPTTTTTDRGSTSKVIKLDFSREPSADAEPGPNVLPQSSWLGKLCGTMLPVQTGSRPSDHSCRNPSPPSLDETSTKPLQPPPPPARRGPLHSTHLAHPVDRSTVMFLQRSAVAVARRAAVAPALRRTFATSMIRQNAPNNTPAKSEKSSKTLSDVKTIDDLVGPGAKPGTVPTDLEQSTGIERLEILGKMEGVDIFDMKPLDASRKGTLKEPILVRSAGEEQFAGCTGYPVDSHGVIWLTITRDRPIERCPECGSVYKMEYLGAQDHHDHGHGHDHHGYEDPKNFSDFVKPEYY